MSDNLHEGIIVAFNLLHLLWLPKVFMVGRWSVGIFWSPSAQHRCPSPVFWTHPSVPTFAWLLPGVPWLDPLLESHAPSRNRAGKTREEKGKVKKRRLKQFSDQWWKKLTQNIVSPCFQQWTQQQKKVNLQTWGGEVGCMTADENEQIQHVQNVKIHHVFF